MLILPRENGGRGESSPGGAGGRERAGPGAPAGAATSQTLPGPGGPCAAPPGQAEQGCPTGWQALWCSLRCQHGRGECPRRRENPTRLWKPWVEAEEPGGDTQGGGEERGRTSDSIGRSEEAVRQAKAAPYRQHLPRCFPGGSDASRRCACLCGAGQGALGRGHVEPSPTARGPASLLPGQWALGVGPASGP